MMKTLKQTSAALMLALAALASGCAADEEMTTTTTTDGEDGELMTITVSMGSDATTRIAYDDSKVSATDNDALRWEAGDKLLVVGYNGNTYTGQEEYTLVAADAGKKTGSFTGKAIPGATQYNVAYHNAAIIVNQNGSPTYSFKAQTQTGDGNPDHLKHNLCLATNSFVTDLSNVQLEMWCNIMKFDLQNVPAEVGTLRKLTWTTEDNVSSPSMELAFSTEAGKAVNFSSNQTLTAYLVFSLLDKDMTVGSGGKFTVTLEGDKTYYAERTVTDGKIYEIGKRYTAKIDGTANTMEWKEKVETVVVSTTVSGGGTNYYNGLEMQIGTWKADGSGEQITLGKATIAKGKASIPVDLSAYSDKPIWVCIPKVAKFFHTLTAQEVADKALTLPDKDGGSILWGLENTNKQYENKWIVALYMGVNKDGATDADAVPIYWATGNLIATKTNDAGSGTNEVAFHIATADETCSEATTDYLPTGIAESANDGYIACAIGAQWNKFGWGDATGLKTSTNSAPDITTSGASISGNATYDIARAKLGGSWRLPTRGSDTTNELAAFADNSVSGLSPDGMDWTESGYTGRIYTYIAANNITNTLKFPAAGYREETVARELSTKGFYWSGTVNDPYSGSEFHFSQGEAKWGFTDRSFGFSVRPVTE